MGYLNNTENQSKYNAIREKYKDAARKRKVAISIEQTHVEVARARVEEINNRLRELGATNKITHELAQERGRLWTLRTAATEQLRQAEQKLAIAQVGQAAIDEVVERITRDRVQSAPSKTIDDELEDAADKIAGHIARKADHKRLTNEYYGKH